MATPNGLGTEQYWAATCDGRSGIRPVRRFDVSEYPVRLAGEVPDYVPEDHLPGRLLPQTDHMTRLALTAADWALEDSGLRPGELSEFDIGVITASSAGGFEFGQHELQNLWSKGSKYVSAYQSFAWFYAVNTGQISIRHGLKGPSGVVVTDGAGALDALGNARRQLRKGSKAIVSGGVDGSICPWGWVAQMAGGRLSNADDPTIAYLPFDARAAGYVAGEGGAILVLEDRESARARGARRVYGEIAGYAATFDPPPGSGRPLALRRAVELALRDASVDPPDVDVVFADAAGSPDLDEAEAEAINTVFGPGAVGVTAPKTMTGRLYAGAAAVDVAAALLAIRDGLIPPTVNVRPDPRFRLDLVVDEPRPARVRTALVVARGHGGFSSALVLRAVSS
nr:ketosynthase beta subunit [uncultured bacterium]